MDEEPNVLKPDSPSQETASTQPPPTGGLISNPSPLGVSAAPPNPDLSQQNAAQPTAASNPNLPIQPQVASSFSGATANSQAQVIATPQTSPQPSDNRKSRKGIFIAGILIILLIIGGVVADTLMSKSSKNLSSSQAQQNDAAAKASNTIAQNKNNTERREDISQISATIQDYVASNNGSLPHVMNYVPTNQNVVEFCGASSSCSDVSSSSINYYKANNILFEKYSSNLKVKSDNDVYIVDNATCKNNTSIGVQTSTPAAAIIFGLQQGSTVEPQCQTSG